MNRQRDDIVCFEAGSGEPSWSGSIEVIGEDLDALRRLADDEVIELELSGNSVHVAGAKRVGLVLLPSGRRLVIRSKIGSLILLEWLSYLGEFPPLQVWLPDPGVTTGDDFHTCIARLFLMELDRLTRLHVRKDYTPITTEDSTIRGRILTTRLYRRLNRLPHIPQRHRSRTFDTSYNIVLALALDKLPMLLAAASQNDRMLLARLRDLWAHVEREITDPVTAVTEAQWASPPGYRAALQLARLILIGAALDPESNMGGKAFTLSLALMWERSLRLMFDEISEMTGWCCVPKPDRTRQWDDSAGRNDPTRWLTADVMVEQGNCRWVLDAKYKRAFGNESRNDRFQMCAYAVAFDGDRVSLVYPTASSQFQQRDLLDAVVGSKQVTIDSINLPMSRGPEICKAALVQLCEAVELGQETAVLA